MALCKVFLFIVGFSGLLLFRFADACDYNAILDCINALTSSGLDANSDRDAYCSALRTYLTCNDNAGISNCGDTTAYDAQKDNVNQYCGAAQYLLSWPLYLAVLIFTFKRLYNYLE
ncbi:hypothetical protein BaRGS_00018010 [Batillaria attramentaria]|uniref:Transmembrane protein n=1 Tax=Batillaria attramentaria TaxID=370345 RepID=A0ABD0KU41_9CAEN